MCVMLGRSRKIKRTGLEVEKGQRKRNESKKTHEQERKKEYQTCRHVQEDEQIMKIVTTMLMMMKITHS